MSLPVQLPLKAIQHIGIPVTDIRRSENFYQSLGFSNVMEAEFTQSEGKGTCIMMQQGAIIIELYQLPGAQLQEVKNRKDGHIDHIAFDVSDIDATYNSLLKAGFNILEPAPVFLQFWKNGCKYFNITGPDGERLEFNQVL
ncbi:MAG: VOC family protein [Chitinophagaceae bacterium]|nr:VOC family protein [Chitinophagaceae bacterium]